MTAQNPPLRIVKKAHFTGHRDCVYCLERHQDPYLFFSSSGDGLVVQWDIRTPDAGVLVAKVTNSVYSLLYLEDQHQLVVGQNYSGIHLIDMATNIEVSSMQCADSYIFDIKPCGDYLLVALGSGEVKLIDPQARKVVRILHYSQKSARSMALHPNLSELAVGYSDHTIRVFSLTDFSLKYTLQGHTLSVFSVKYSPDGHFLYSCGRDAHIRTWDCWDHYAPLEAVAAHMFAVNFLDFSPDGGRMVSGSMDKTLKIWDTQPLRLAKVLDKSRHAGHSTSVNRVMWLGGQHSFLSASDDKTIIHWEIEHHDR